MAASEIAIPTALAKPWPRGPVVTWIVAGSVQTFFTVNITIITFFSFIVVVLLIVPKIWGFTKFKGLTLLGSLSQGNPPILGIMLGFPPYFRKPPFRVYGCMLGVLLVHILA